MTDTTAAAKPIVVVGYGQAYANAIDNNTPITSNDGMLNVYTEDTPFIKLIDTILCDADGWDSFYQFTVEPDHPSYELWCDNTTPAVDIWNTYHAQEPDNAPSLG